MSYKSVPALGKDWLTPFFDTLLAVVGLETPLTERVIERAHIQNGEHLLGVGCGTATLLIAVKSRYPSAQMVGADTDERALAIARKKIAQYQLEVEVMQARAEHLPFPTSSFDIVMSTLIFNHLPTEIKQCAMAEIYRVLRPGGRFLLADLGKPEGLLLKTTPLEHGSASSGTDIVGPLHVLSQHRHQVALSLDDGYRHRQCDRSPRRASDHFQGHHAVRKQTPGKESRPHSILRSGDPAGSLPTVQPASEVVSSH